MDVLFCGDGLPTPCDGEFQEFDFEAHRSLSCLASSLAPINKDIPIKYTLCSALDGKLH